MLTIGLKDSSSFTIGVLMTGAGECRQQQNESGLGGVFIRVFTSALKRDAYP